MRVLVLGGTGVFGSRLCRLLAADPGIALTVAARDRAAVDALARDLGVEGRAFDWRADLDRVLGEGGHDLVVHVAGPFQGQDYAVAELCIRHGVHYVDLADDSAFVRGIDRLAEAALKANVLVCSGASTVPAITGAVVEEALKTGPVERVAFGIMPGNDAPRGPALVAAILGGAGRPIADQPGRHVWGDLRRMKLPGLGRRWVAACDLPEPALFAQRFGIRDTYAGAGMELSILHVGLWSLSWLVRGRLVRSLAPAAPLLARIADRLLFLGTDRGGLRLELHAGAGIRVWCLIAEAGDGPFIPVTPAAALVRKMARGASLRCAACAAAVCRCRARCGLASRRPSGRRRGASASTFRSRCRWSGDWFAIGVGLQIDEAIAHLRRRHEAAWSASEPAISVARDQVVDRIA